MRCLYFLLLASPTLAQTRAPKTLRFDLTALPTTRDSFVFLLDRKEAGFAVWQYETRSTGTGETVVFTQHSELQPLEQEEQRMVMDRATARPLSFYYHLELFSPASDTLLVEVELNVKNGTVDGHRLVNTKSGRAEEVAVHRALPPEAVWSALEFYGAAVTNAEPGESLAVPAYRETRDSITMLRFVAGEPATIQVRAGRFQVLPLRSGDLRLYVTRVPPRRVVKGETSDGRFSFELAGIAAVVPTQP